MQAPILDYSAKLADDTACSRNSKPDAASAACSVTARDAKIRASYSCIFFITKSCNSFRLFSTFETRIFSKNRSQHPANNYYSKPANALRGFATHHAHPKHLTKNGAARPGANFGLLAKRQRVLGPFTDPHK